MRVRRSVEQHDRHSSWHDTLYHRCVRYLCEWCESISTNGTVINGCRITGALNIHANNVTIENSDISSINDGLHRRPSGYCQHELLNDDIHGPSAATGNSLGDLGIEQWRGS